MLTPVPSRTGNRDQGFTLIELLVVFTIVAILSAIAIPVLLSQRTKAVDASRKSDLKNTVTALEAHHIAPRGYPVGGITSTPRSHPLGAEHVDVSTGNTLSYVDPATDGTVNAHCPTADNPAGTKSRVRSDVGAVQPHVGRPLLSGSSPLRDRYATRGRRRADCSRHARAMPRNRACGTLWCCVGCGGTSWATRA